MARQIELTTPLGTDVLLFRAMHGREELGRISEFDLSALSTQGDIKPGDLLAKNVTVSLVLQGGGYRYFNGYVTRFAHGGMFGRYYEYRMTVRSWLWFLTRTADCRIFQEKTVPEIIKEVFADHSTAVFEDGLTGTYAKREYCVQYRETDFNFVSRLMEEEGIYHYLEHGNGRHVMKLVDSYSGHKPLENTATVPYYPPHRLTHTDEEYIHAWAFAQSIQPGSVALDDYDFIKPKADLTVKAKLIEPHELADYEVFDYPGEYLQTGDGEHYVRARVDEFHAEFDRAQAECNVREIAAGRLFNLTNTPRRDQEREYLIVGAECTLRDDTYETSSDEGATYHCVFTAMQSRQQFRPARITPEPKVQGPQTAMVVGPAGEEIWTDKYGRVKVQFHWDRYGKKDENSSCWIRVSHPWAGKNWGAVSIPRIGQEVIVDFLEGDPDQPIITGRVYNADTMPPYGLPAGAVVSGIKSNSTKGGGGYNEISMNDTKGTELIQIHGQYDMDTKIEHDERITIVNNRTESVGANETVSIALMCTHMVGVNDSLTVGAAQEVTIGGAQLITVGAARALSVGGSHSISVGGSQSETIGKNLTIDAGDSIVVKTGAASISMKKDGTIVIEGKDITIKASGTIVGKATGDMTLKASKIGAN